MRQADTVATQAGARFLVVTTPTAGDYKLGHPHSQYTRVLEMLAAADVPTIDMFAVTQARQVPPDELYQQHAGDDHYTVLGQRLVAGAIADGVLGKR